MIAGKEQPNSVVGQRRTTRGLHDGTLPKFLKRGVVAQTALMLLALWSYTAWRLTDDYERTLNIGRQQLRTVSAGLHTHVEAILNDGIGSAIATGKGVEARGGFTHISDEALAELLSQHLTGGDYVRGLFIATPQRYAQITRTTAVLTQPVPPDWLQIAMKEDRGENFVGRSIELQSREVERVVPVAVQMGGNNGEPIWVGALLGLSSLDRLYRRMRFDEGVLGVYVPNGDVLVRVPQLPPEEITPEVRARRARLTQQQMALGEEVFFEIAGPISGARTMFYTRRVAGYPLVVSAGRSRESVLTPWRERATAVAAALSGISVLLIGLTVLLRHFATRLERRESHYRTLFNNSAACVFMIADDTFVEANATTYETFRFPLDIELKGLHLWDISPPYQPDSRESSVVARERLETARALGQLSFRWLCKRMDTDEPFPAQVNLSSMRIGDQSLMLAILHDITELEGARLQLQSLNAELENRVAERTAALQDANARLALTNQELEAFTASASHDLRSPLGSIAGQAGLLREEMAPVLNDTALQRLDRITDSVKRCAEIIDGLLSLAKLSRQELISEYLDVSALARGIVENLRLQSPNRNLTWVIPDGVTLEADPRLIKSLLENLLDNAWKYTAKVANPTIELRCEDREGTPQLSVIDNGVGFDMAYARRLFEPFQRMHSAADFPGTGIGLATVARIVQRYGGRIWVESAPGQGASFHFTLPLANVRCESLLPAGAGSA